MLENSPRPLVDGAPNHWVLWPRCLLRRSCEYWQFFEVFPEENTAQIHTLSLKAAHGEFDEFEAISATKHKPSWFTMAEKKSVYDS